MVNDLFKLIVVYGEAGLLDFFHPFQKHLAMIKHQNHLAMIKHSDLMGIITLSASASKLFL